MDNLNDPQLKYKVGINMIPGIGSVLAKKIIEFTGSPEEVFRTSESTLLTIPGIGKTLARNITNHEILYRAEKELEFISRYRIRPLYYLDDGYPERLKQCPDSPVILFVKGTIGLDHPRVLSIVGTRSASSYGLEFCRHLISELAAKGYDPVIVSGLAYGIDICAHRAALDNGLQTVAVLAHGMATVYPREHRDAAEKITGQGALVTDFESYIQPDRGNFLKRNRIIAGIADATLVIESSMKGGALITADLAGSYNRDVFALPGRVTDKRSQGCNNLIKTNKAALIEQVKDLEYIMGWMPGKGSAEREKPDSRDDLSDDERVLIRTLVPDKELPADLISAETGFSAGKTSSLLLNLEINGYVTSLPGKIYRLAVFNFSS